MLIYFLTQAAPKDSALGRMYINVVRCENDFSKTYNLIDTEKYAGIGNDLLLDAVLQVSFSRVSRQNDKHTWRLL